MTPRSAPGRTTPDLSFFLDHTSHVLRTQMAAALDEIGLTPRMHCVLVHALEEERTQIQLAEIGGMDKTTMVVTVDALEKGRTRRTPPVVHGPARPDHRRHREGREGRRAQPGDRGRRPRGRARLPPRRRARGVPARAEHPGQGPSGDPRGKPPAGTPRPRAHKIVPMRIVSNKTICYGLSCVHEPREDRARSVRLSRPSRLSAPSTPSAPARPSPPSRPGLRAPPFPTGPPGSGPGGRRWASCPRRC